MLCPILCLDISINPNCEILVIWTLDLSLKNNSFIFLNKVRWTFPFIPCFVFCKVWLKMCRSYPKLFQTFKNIMIGFSQSLQQPIFWRLFWLAMPPAAAPAWATAHCRPRRVGLRKVRGKTHAAADAMLPRLVGEVAWAGADAKGPATH